MISDAWVVNEIKIEGVKNGRLFH